MFSYIVIIIVIGLKVSYGSTAVLPFIFPQDYPVSDVWLDLRVLA